MEIRISFLNSPSRIILSPIITYWISNGFLFVKITEKEIRAYPTANMFDLKVVRYD